MKRIIAFLFFITILFSGCSSGYKFEVVLIYDTHSEESIKHIIFDVLPWAVFGNDDDDPGPVINQIICLFE